MARPSLTYDQKVAWLRLARSERIGTATFHNLINRFGSAQLALDELPEISRRAGGARGPRIFSEEAAKRELDEAERLGIRHIAFGEDGYPSLLRETDGKPPFLLVQGNGKFDRLPHVAIVGSRNASVAGKKMASTLAHDLADHGHVVVSGLARGIDTAAHQSSLKTGTVAVIAGGHQHLYPAENKSLVQEILDHQGTIVSEMPPSFEPRGKDFPRRNRIISGLCIGVIIVEAAHRSGSLITARLAAEQGRQVFAVPGSPLDPRADGTNDLIREGATLIRSADDVINDLRPMTPLDNEESSNQQPFRLETGKGEDFDTEYMPETVNEVILQGLSNSPVYQDDIIRHTNLTPSLVVASLVELEISGRVERCNGNMFVLAV